jgi:hypothetical protein
MGRYGAGELDLEGMETPQAMRIDLGRGAHGEIMSGATVDACLGLLARSDLTIVDLDGPPPEQHPRFREIVILVRALRRRLLHRCNLAASENEPGQLAELLADHRVDVVAALPGWPMVEPSTLALLQALRRFNAAGYGQPSTGLMLELVVPAPLFDRDRRPSEVSLAGALEAQGVRFSGLHVVAPVEDAGGGLVSRLQRLTAMVSPARVLGVPCRSVLAVSWDGALSEWRDGEVVPLGRNVREVRSVEDAYVASLEAAPAEAAVFASP